MTRWRYLSDRAAAASRVPDARDVRFDKTAHAASCCSYSALALRTVSVSNQTLVYTCLNVPIKTSAPARL